MGGDAFKLMQIGIELHFERAELLDQLVGVHAAYCDDLAFAGGNQFIQSASVRSSGPRVIRAGNSALMTADERVGVTLLNSLIWFQSSIPVKR